MQGNIEQMAALTKLVHVNNPNLVVFVGSALDGNDSVDQLTKFNQALIDHSPSSTPRTLDGIILTKFDTIDEKVGTTISLVYSSGLPIIFLGVGQHYNSLKQMNTQAVINALLK
jgi:signal recognition particle receptor subunit alpha